MSGGREVVVLGLAGGGSESGIQRTFEVSLYQLFMHLYPEHVHYAQNPENPLSKKEKWVHSKKNVVNTIPLKITLLKAAYF